jgi:hypothetical protein
MGIPPYLNSGINPAVLVSSHIRVLLADLIADGLLEVAGEPGGGLGEGVFTSEMVLLTGV